MPVVEHNGERYEVKPLSARGHRQWTQYLSRADLEFPTFDEEVAKALASEADDGDARMVSVARGILALVRENKRAILSWIGSESDVGDIWICDCTGITRDELDELSASTRFKLLKAAVEATLDDGYVEAVSDFFTVLWQAFTHRNSQPKEEKTDDRLAGVASGRVS